MHCSTGLWYGLVSECGAVRCQLPAMHRHHAPGTNADLLLECMAFLQAHANINSPLLCMSSNTAAVLYSAGSTMKQLDCTCK
jgi:hypothetical protein